MSSWVFSADQPGRIEARHFIDAIRAGRPIEASHIVIDDDLDCSALQCAAPLRVRDSVFKGNVDFSDCNFARVDLTGCVFEKQFTCRRAAFDNRLVFNRASFQSAADAADFTQIKAALDVEGEGSAAAGGLKFNRAEIHGSLRLQSTASQRTVLAGVLDLSRVAIGGDLFLRGISSKEIRLHVADIGGTLLLDGTEQHRAVVDGDLLLGMAKIGGMASLQGIHVKGAFDGTSLTVGGQLYCPSETDRLTEFASRVGLGKASIGGDVVMDGVRIAGDLEFADSTIRGNFGLRSGAEGASIGGSLIFLGADILGTLWLSGAHIHGAVFGQYSSVGEVAADMIAARRTEIDSGVFFSAMRVRQNVGFRGAVIRGSLQLDQSIIGGGVHCASIEGGGRTEIGGEVSLAGVSISASAAFDGASIAGMLFAENAKIAGALSFTTIGEHRTELNAGLFMIRGRAALVAFNDAIISGPLNLTHAEIGGVHLGDVASKISKGLFADRLKADYLILHGDSVSGGPVSLGLARIGILEIRGAIPSETELTGCEIQRFTLPGDDYRGLLASTKPFRIAAYAGMEKWLRERGDESRANRIYVDMRRRRRNETLRGFSWLVDWFLDFSALYGIAAYRLIAYLAAVLCLSALLLSCPGALQPDPPGPRQAGLREAAWVATQTTFPMFAIPAAKPWRAAAAPVYVGRSRLPLTYDGYASAISLISWIVVPLFIVSITGLLKKQT